MGETAENLAERYSISREEQDEYALQSHQRALAAQRDGRFDGQIVPVMVSAGKQGTTRFAIDEHPRAETTSASLAKLRPVFRKDGTVTAGNSSGMNDGAAALVMMSVERARAEGREVLATLKRSRRRRRASGSDGTRSGAFDAQAAVEDRPDRERPQAG